MKHLKKNRNLFLEFTDHRKEMSKCLLTNKIGCCQTDTALLQNFHKTVEKKIFDWTDSST